MRPTEERMAYLELALTPHIGPVGLLKLLQHCTNACEVFALPQHELSNLVSAKACQSLQQRQGQAPLEMALNWQQQKPNRHLITLLDDHYPLALTQQATPPPILFAQGQLNLLEQPQIAIVGSRHASAAGKQIAESFATELSQNGFCITSGMAAGIDTAAHLGCLKVQGKTIAIIGTGIDRVYPASNHALAHHISEQGLLVSEFALQTPPLSQNFPRRNRLIAALSDVVLIVEASLQSGSLITARLGLEMNKEVMAIPGSIHNPQSKGCHFLIKQGAKLVEAVSDILEECPNLPQSKSQLNSPETDPQHPCMDTASSTLLDNMGFDPIHPDQLIDKLGTNATDVYAELLQLELQGHIAAVAGGRYQRIH